MSLLIVKSFVLLAWTQTLRALGRRAGPHRAGLLLGLPSTTAIALISCAFERGQEAADAMADAALLGLIAAVALPMVYARSLGRSGHPARALASALAAYAAVAAILCHLPAFETSTRIALAVAAMVVADRRVGPGPAGGGRESASSGGDRALRALTPVACLMLLTLVRDRAGDGWAGLLTPFPGTTLALLIAIHAESGPAAAFRMARAVPRGSLGTLAFLAVFRYAGPVLGPAWAAAWGYTASLATLWAVEWSTRSGRDVGRRDQVAGVSSEASRRDGPRPGASRPWPEPPRAAGRAAVGRRAIARTPDLAPARFPPLPLMDGRRPIGFVAGSDVSPDGLVSPIGRKGHNKAARGGEIRAGPAKVGVGRPRPWHEVERWRFAKRM